MNVIARAVEAIGATGDRGTLEGFCATVSGFIGAAVSGCALDERYIRKHMIMRMMATGFGG